MTRQIFEGLDPEQRDAVFSGARALLIAAPPGSGKTRVLICRFMRLVEEGAPPSGILAITFTNRAAREIKERLSTHGMGQGLANIGTFHSICLKMLKAKDPGLTLYSREDQRRVLKGLGVKGVEAAADLISGIKNSPRNDLGNEEMALYSRYTEALKDAGALDFDDLIPGAVKALDADTEAFGGIKHVMVDEYQDINPAQRRLLKLLSRGASIFAIGDPDQAIYSFRGASLKGFHEFNDDYPGAGTMGLRRNYRSSSRIVEASNAVIGNNAGRAGKETLALSPGGEIRAIECADEDAEAAIVIREIESMMGGLASLTVGEQMEGARFSDFAVLFRTNRQAAPIIEAFDRSSIPYHVVARPGPGFADFIHRLRAMELTPGAELSALVRAEGVEAGLDEDLLNILVDAARLHDNRPIAESIKDFIEEAALTEPVDNCDIKADKVNLMTLHMAKGLEFRVVFIAGVEDGLMPLRLKGEECDVEEERRLFYVGMTRARERLILLGARQRRLWGETRDRAPSPFLAEMPERLVKKERVEKKKTKRRAEQKGLFE
ncbi:MAG: ATP-dependent helicase [Deltaproteobacteria bacterium]|nr:ATP-dependent helicase [Deltaproteobacteria bacterium]